MANANPSTEAHDTLETDALPMPAWDRLDSVMLGFLLVLTLARLGLASSFPLVSDETYYSLWASRLSFSYLDHPPMVAWLIALSKGMFGNGELGVRFFAPVFLGLGGWFWYRTVKPEAGYGALFFVAGLQLSPLVHGVGLIMTPDVPFLFFLGAVLALYRRRALVSHTWQAPLMGFLVAMGMLSKLSMAPLIMLWFIQAPEQRNRRLTLLYGLGLALPILIWQVGAAGSPHESGPLVFQLDRFLDVHFTPFGPFEFLGAWALVALPVLGVALPYGLYGQFINPTTMTVRELGPLAFAVLYVLLLLPGTILGFFEANWLLPVLLLFAFGTCGYWFRVSTFPNGRQVYTLQTLAGILAMLLVHLYFFTWTAWPEWTSWGMLRHAGWQESAEKVEALAQGKEGLIRVPHYEELGQFCHYGSKEFCQRLRLSNARGEALDRDEPTPWCLERLDEKDIRTPEAVIRLDGRFLRAYRLSPCSEQTTIVPSQTHHATETL